MQLSRASYPSRRDFLRLSGLGAAGLAAVGLRGWSDHAGAVRRGCGRLVR